jgi:hypothetical protein
VQVQYGSLQRPPKVRRHTHSMEPTNTKFISSRGNQVHPNDTHEKHRKYQGDSLQKCVWVPWAKGKERNDSRPRIYKRTRNQAPLDTGRGLQHYHLPCRKEGWYEKIGSRCGGVFKFYRQSEDDRPPNQEWIVHVEQ